MQGGSNRNRRGSAPLALLTLTTAQNSPFSSLAVAVTIASTQKAGADRADVSMYRPYPT